jgi:fumarate hydratase, class II
MPNIRTEANCLGEFDVGVVVVWGAQTQRSPEHFAIGHDLIPREMIARYVTLKRCILL